MYHYDQSYWSYICKSIDTFCIRSEKYHLGAISLSPHLFPSLNWLIFLLLQWNVYETSVTQHGCLWKSTVLKDLYMTYLFFSMYQDDKISLLLQVETLEELCAKILIQLKVWFNIHTPTFFRERVIACSFYRISTHSLLHNFHKLVFLIPKASLTEEQIFQPPK